MGRVWWSTAILAALLAGCSGGASADQKAEEVPSITRPDLEVFMRLTVTKAQTDGMRAAIRSSSSVRTFAHLSQQDALRVFRQLYATDPHLIATTTANELPTSFVIRLRDTRDAKEVVRKLGRLPGVDEVKDRNDAEAIPKAIERLCKSRRDRSGPGDVEVFLFMDVTAAETDAVRTALEQAPAVRALRFLTHEDALREFRRLFADRPKVLRGMTADQLPTSFRLDVVVGEPAGQLLAALGQMPGVEEIKEGITLAQCTEFEARTA